MEHNEGLFAAGESRLVEELLHELLLDVLLVAPHRHRLDGPGGRFDADVSASVLVREACVDDADPFEPASTYGLHELARLDAAELLARSHDITEVGALGFFELLRWDVLAEAQFCLMSHRALKDAREVNVHTGQDIVGVSPQDFVPWLTWKFRVRVHTLVQMTSFLCQELDSIGSVFFAVIETFS